ncbi:MAG: hypothetical protein ACRCYO_03015 [Bacteroidia bacterium]
MTNLKLFFEEYGTLLALGGALLSFIWGVYQYLMAQRWKSAEFALNELTKVFEHPNTKLIHRMLDYNACKLTLLIDEQEEEIYFDDERLKWMLRPHEVNGKLSQADMAVRDAFDRYFLDMERIHYLMRIGMIDKKAVYPYFGYWLDIMGRKNGTRKPKETILAIHNYIHYYKLAGVISLLMRFGFYTSYDKNLKYVEFVEKES